jgi:hypothetical protein
MKRIILLFLLLFVSPAQAQVIIGPLPYTLTNGQVADANQVMANFNAIVNSTNANAANAGVNTNITALTALSTPINPSQGGTSIYVGGTSSNVGNAYTITSPSPTGFSLTTGKTVCFIVNAGNTGATTLNVNATGATNFFRQPTNVGTTAMVGGELTTGMVACAYYDGTQFQCTNCGHSTVGALVDYTGVIVPSGWVYTNGQALSRTTFAAAFSTIAFTSVAATTTATSTTITITGANTFLQVGWFVGGPNVTCNSTISSVATNSIVINNAAGTGGSTTLTIGPYPQGDCSTTFNAPNLTGRVTAQVDGTTNITAPNCANSASLGSTCGGQSTTLATANLPAYTPTGTITNGALTVNNVLTIIGGPGTFVPGGGSSGSSINPSAAFTVTQAASMFNGGAQGGTDTPFTNLPPLGLVYKIMKL